MIKAIFMELNSELGLNVVIGEKIFETDNVKSVHEESKIILDVLKQIKSNTVSYMLEKNGGIIVSLSFNK